MNPKKVRIYPNCVITKGKNRSIICDLQRGKFDFIPNVLFEILSKYKNHTIQDVKNDFDVSNHFYIEEYFSFLAENEYVFFTSNPENFPLIDFDYNTNKIISNAIIETGAELSTDMESIFNQLNELGCFALEMRIIGNISLNLLESIFKVIGNFVFESIHLLIPYTKEIDSDILESLLRKYPNLYTIYVYGASKNKSIFNKDHNKALIYTNNGYENLHCGHISLNKLRINTNFYFESKKYNSCLYQKVAIDKNGNIKNCLFSEKVYGNVKLNKIKSIVTKNEFQDLWCITKDQISVCKECEFRYVCPDCRFFTVDNQLLSKPKYCNYNPLIEI